MSVSEIIITLLVGGNGCDSFNLWHNIYVYKYKYVWAYGELNRMLK